MSPQKRDESITFHPTFLSPSIDIINTSLAPNLTFCPPAYRVSISDNYLGESGGRGGGGRGREGEKMKGKFFPQSQTQIDSLLCKYSIIFSFPPS
jgi:hypothetical protein